MGRLRAAEAIAARSYLALLDSVSPIKNLTSLNERKIRWGDAGMYFDGMADPYKVFTFSVGAGPDKRTVSMSTAELMKIDKAGFSAARDELSRVLSELQEAGIVALENPWTSGAAAHYRHLGNPSGMLSEYPYTNDVFFADPNQRVEGMAIPKSVSPMYLTPRALDARVFSGEAMIRTMERIWAAVGLLHSSANANASVSPAVHIAMNRLGMTQEWFDGMDATARDSLVPKTRGIPEMDVLRGSWADNRYFGDHGEDRSLVYSNKNAYLPGLGNPRDTRVPEIYRDAELGGDHTRFVNPCFPEALQPIHFAKLPPAGSSPTAGFLVAGPSDARWMLSLNERRPMWTFSDDCLIGMGNSGVGGGNDGRRLRRGMKPAGPYPGSGNLYNQWQGSGNIPFDGDLASWENHASRLDETNGPYGVMRRLRDWYYANKPKCVITVSDAVTDFAASVQLARFLSEVPPHVLLHSVMGYHNALLKLSFRQVNVPYSTNIDQYEMRMRIEREAIAANAARFNLIGHGTTEPGYALTVKAPDSVVMADAGLQAATVASLSVAGAAFAANPIAGCVCLALVGCAILIAELSGGRAQNLVTPRDRSREDLRSDRNKGLRCNWFRGITPEYVVNAAPVVRT